MTKRKKQKIVYWEGYNHYGHRRDIAITFLVNEAEKAALEDLMAVLEEKNMSTFIRGAVFRVYNDLSEEQKRQLQEVAEWRKETHPGPPCLGRETHPGPD